LKTARLVSGVSRIVYVGLGVVCLHLAVLWLVQVGSQPVAPVRPTFLIQIAPSPLSNNTPATPPSNATRLPSPKASKVPQKNKRVEPKPQAPLQATADAIPLPTKVENIVASTGSNPGNNSTAAPAPERADLWASQTNSVKGSAAPSLQLPSSSADYLNNPAAIYPAISQRLGEQGKVVIRVLITKEGSARQGEVLQSSGFDRLDQAALRAVMSWRYAPGQRAGAPQDMWFNVPINFTLN
jgi:protein TonB